MITIWFLMALMTYPDVNSIHYRGFGGYLEKEHCEERSIVIENYITIKKTMFGQGFLEKRLERLIKI